MNRILIVIDMQNDFITGSLGTKEAREIVPKVEKKIEEYQNNNDAIIFTRDTHKDDYPETAEGRKLPVKHCVKNTDGWKIGLKVNPYDYRIVNKSSFGYCNWEKIIFDYLTAKKYQDVTIELVGVCTDICVVSNALIIKALYPEINIVVDASCCAGSTPEKHKAALEVMKSCQIDVIGEE